MTDSQQKSNNQRSARPQPAALNIEVPALTQPYKDYVSRGLIEIKVSFGPMGTNVGITPLGPIREAGESSDTILPYGEARRRIEAKGLAMERKSRGEKKGNGKQPLPLKSLCEEDFNGSDQQLIARIKQVGTALGPDVVRSRIMTLKLNAEGHDDFESWWASADAEHRSRLLMDNKHMKKIGEAVSKLSQLTYPCPFRGSLSPPQAEKAEKKEGEKNTKGKANGTSSPAKAGPSKRPGQAPSA